MTDIPTMTGSEALIFARLRKGWKQSECAEELGVHRITLSNWERGKSSPHPENLGRIAEVLDIDPALFFDKPSKSAAVNFGRRLRQARLDAGLTLAYMEDWTNRSVRTIEGWERGEQVPNAKNIAVLERAYECNLDIRASKPAPLPIEKAFAHLMEGLRSLKPTQQPTFGPHMEGLLRHISEIIEPVYNVKASNENSRDERVRRLAPPHRAWGQVS